MSKQQLAEPKQEQQQQPRVFIGIPTGPPKLYSTYIMIAALANLDYTNYEVHWAVTGGYDNKLFGDFKRRLKKLNQAVKWPDGVTWHIHYVPLRKKERMTRYLPILRNKTVLRDTFLDGDCPYFLLLGGDNPPPRNTMHRLFKADADVSIGLCYQRPNVDQKCGSYPLVWRYAWMPSELEQFKDELNPLVMDELRLAWLHCPVMIPVMFDPNWKRKRTIRNITGGDGCALIKRRVLEMVDWGVTPDNAYHSEDIHFMTLALWHGFTTACAIDLHVPHFDSDGKAY